MKQRLLLLFLSLVLLFACKKSEVGKPPVVAVSPPVQSTAATLTHTPTQAVATHTATATPTITPSNTWRPLNTPRPSWTPSATPTWWGLPPATPVNDVPLTPFPSPAFDQSSTPVYVNGTPVFNPDRQAEWLEALSPLPYLEFPISLEADADSGETMTVTMDFNPVQMIEINLDQDEAPEIALAYLLNPPGYSEEIFTLSEYEAYTHSIRFYYGDAHIAIFDDDGELLEKSEAAPLEFISTIELSSVNLSANLKGVFFSHHGLTTATWKSRGTKILYIWQDSELKVAWHWEKEFISFASSQRFTPRTQVWDQVSFQDVDNDGYEEFLFAHRVFNLQNEISRRCCLYYFLNYPGALVYKWRDDGFRSAYLLDDGRLQPIRSESTTTLAPFVDGSIVVDGDLLDWYQIEYVNLYHDLTYDECTLPGKVKIGWDDENLYISFLLLPEEEIVLGLDTDFETDFGTTISDRDEVFLTVSVDDEEVLDLSLEAELNVNDLAIVSAIGEPTYRNLYSYPVEISIPLAQLGLDEVMLTSQIGWGIIYEANSAYENRYYPLMQARVGFAVQTNQDQTWPTCFGLNDAITMETAALDMNNPTTWGTLVFTADRGTPIE